MDAFVTSTPVHMMVKKLSGNNSKYNLKWVGEALAWKNIHNVRIDFAKPDTLLADSSAHIDWAMEKVFLLR